MINTLRVAVDHGNRNMKTSHVIFTSGLNILDKKPARGEQYLQYEGKYYTLSEQRIPYQRDKTTDFRFSMGQEITNVPKAVGIDIGGFTTDYLLMRKGRPDMGYCDSLEKGVITMYNQIISSVNSEYDMLLEDADIDSIVEGNTRYYEDSVVRMTENMVQDFVTDLLNSIRERGIDTKSSYTVFIGGGAVLLKHFLEKSDRLGKYLFIEDLKANARGYDLLYRAYENGK